MKEYYMSKYIDDIIGFVVGFTLMSFILYILTK